MAKLYIIYFTVCVQYIVGFVLNFEPKVIYSLYTVYNTWNIGAAGYVQENTYCSTKAIRSRDKCCTQNLKKLAYLQLRCQELKF